VDDVVNAVVDCFVEESARRRRTSSESATGWVVEQLPRLRSESRAAQERLREFQETHKILSPDSEHSIVSKRLVMLNDDVTEAERARIELEAELAQLEAAEREPAAIEFLPSISGTESIRRLDSGLHALRSERISLLAKLRPDHPDVKTLDARMDELRSAIQTKIRGALSALRKRVEAARAKEAALREKLAEQERKTLELNEKLIRLGALKTDADRARQLLDHLLDQAGKLNLVSGLNAVPVQIDERAVEPPAPVRPRKTLIITIGAIVGLLLGFVSAVLVERAYSRIRTPEELAQLAGLRTMATIPHMTAKEEKKLFLACHYDPSSAAAEAYRSIRTGLLVSRTGEGPVVFLVTSAVDQEGKTTTALNVASALAQTQRRVLLVDADMRRSSIHRLFEMERERGLSTFLGDGAEAEEVVRDSEVPGLSVVTAGRPPDNPSELLGSGRMPEFLSWARGSYDFIVLDSPPVVAVTDASVLAPLADGVLLVVRAERTPRRAAAHGREVLENAKANLLGAVLNDCPRDRRGYYGYGYGYGYYRYGGYYTYRPEKGDEDAEARSPQAAKPTGAAS
jgi:capsular exopolysaccharide synthesis family protein